MNRNTLPGKYDGFTSPLYPSYVISSRYVPGYDGTKLAVDVVRPADGDGKAVEDAFPVLLLISRGGRFKDVSDKTGSDIIDHCVPYGYVGVVAEMRGCGASYGTNDSFCSIENRQDVTCILNWIAEQPFCNGRVATFGGSNRGLAQFAASVAKPAPSKVLKAITPVVANADFYYQDYPNGVCALSLRHKLSGSEQEKAPKMTKEELLKKVKPVDEDPNGDMAYEAYLTGQYGKNHGFMGYLLLEDMCRDDPNPNFENEQTNLTIPPITDIDVFKASDIKVHQFAGFIESGAFGQLMAAREWGGSILVGPWDHHESRRGTKGFPEGMFDFCSEHRKWFDAVLKDVDNGWFEKPPVMYYTQNAKPGEYWRCSDTWPLETVRPLTLYLTPDATGTVDSVHDGSLSRTKPERETDTAYPVDLSISAFDNGEGSTMDRMRLTWDGDMTEGVDKKSLTFTSAPLFRMYENEITGETPVELWVSCDKPDADFVLYLEEVKADGTSKYVAMGCQRASHRTEAPRAAWNEVGVAYHPSMRADVEDCLREGLEQPVKLSFHLEPISYVFSKGSRIRLTVSCANSQIFQHNLYDPEDLPTIRLYQGGDHASFIRLPFVEHEENVFHGTVTRDGESAPGSLYFFKNNTYLYTGGRWHKYAAGSDEMRYTVEDGEAVFAAGFRFRLEGAPTRDGILREYQGGDPCVIPFPAHRHILIDRVPVADNKDFLFAPDVKSLCMEVFAPANGDKKAPCVVNIHGYNGTPSALRPEVAALTRHGYAVAGIDLRNYPSNTHPDYVYDLKGNVRYLRAHAAELGIDPDRIGCYGQSLGGNSSLFLATTGGEEEMEGTVGGNAGVSSRVQAAVAGFAWSDLLTMGPDLQDEYRDADEKIREAKFRNSDGPFAPLGQVIGFAGEGKGIKVLRDYLEEGKEGSDPYMDGMLQAARNASPVTHIAPDTAPLALFGGLGMTRVDIPYGQSERTFRQCNRYSVDCYLYMNTNGNYGARPEIAEALVGFLDKNLKKPSEARKTVAVPGSCRAVEDARDVTLAYPVFRLDDKGTLLVAAAYIKDRYGVSAAADDTDYVPVGALTGTGVQAEYYEDKNMAVVARASWLQSRDFVDRTGK